MEFAMNRTSVLAVIMVVCAASTSFAVDPLVQREIDQSDSGEIIFNSRHSPVDDAAFKVIGAKTDLLLLKASGKQVTDAGLFHIRNLRRLKILEVPNNNITDQGVAYLGAMIKLEVLNLSGTKVTGRGFAQLDKLKIRRLVLSNTPVDQNLIHLQKVGAIESLVLSKCGLLDSAALAHVAKIKGLKYLDLSGNAIEDVSVVLSSGTLTSLDLSKSDLSDEVWEKVLEAGERLTSLNLSDSGLTDETLRRLGDLPNLKSLTFFRTPQIKGTGIAHLRKLEVLETGTMGRKVHPVFLANIARLKSLKKLSLTSPEIDDAFVEQLVAGPKIEELTLRQSNISARGLASLQTMKSLKHLTITSANFSARDASMLKIVMKNVQVDARVVGAAAESVATSPGTPDAEMASLVANVSKAIVEMGAGRTGLILANTPMNDGQLSAVISSGVIDKIHFLDLSRTDITGQGLVKLGRLKNLEILYLAFTRIEDGDLSLLGEIKSLKELRLMGCVITNAGVAKLTRMPIEKLNLSNCEKLSDGAMEILRSMASLKSLDILATLITPESVGQFRTARKGVEVRHTGGAVLASKLKRRPRSGGGTTSTPVPARGGPEDAGAAVDEQQIEFKLMAIGNALDRHANSHRGQYPLKFANMTIGDESFFQGWGGRSFHYFRPPTKLLDPYRYQRSTTTTRRSLSSRSFDQMPREFERRRLERAIYEKRKPTDEKRRINRPMVAAPDAVKEFRMVLYASGEIRRVAEATFLKQLVANRLRRPNVATASGTAAKPATPKPSTPKSTGKKPSIFDQMRVKLLARAKADNPNRVKMDSGGNIIELDFSGLSFSNTDLTLIKGIKTLRVLSLAKANINDAGVAYLMTMRRLEKVDISGTAITYAGAKKLQSGNSQLKITR
jgi:Leucine-rich repeat (LRR) protein